MALLGIDYGTKKIGLAKSVQSLAVPFMILENKGDDFVIEKIQHICKEEGIVQVVVGIPLSIKNEQGGKAESQSVHTNKVLQFMKRLQDKLTIDVVGEDERMSTKMAKTLNKGISRDKHDDDISAMLILQAYLDRERLS